MQSSTTKNLIVTSALLVLGCGTSSDLSALRSPNDATVPTPPASSVQTRYITRDESFNDYRPTFSPDDRKVVFERNAVRPKGEVMLHLIDTAGGPVTPILDASFRESSTRPDWSETSNRIAFTASGAHGDSLWVVNPDGSNRFQVAPPEFRKVVDYPHWFPDGNSVAVVDYGDPPITNFKGIIRKVGIPPAPGSLQNLTDPAQILAGDSSVSSDGRWLTLAAQSEVQQPYNQDTNQIFVVDLSSPGSAPILFDRGQGRAPSFSPDGKFVLFESNRGSNNGLYSIYIKAFYGKPGDVDAPATRLTEENLDCQHAEFSHDGRKIVLSALQQANSAGSGPRGILLIEFTAP